MSGKAEACVDCGAMLRNIVYRPTSDSTSSNATLSDAALKVGEKAMDSKASVLAKSEQGDLAIYAKDTSDELTLIFQKGGNEPETVFENKRR